MCQFDQIAPIKLETLEKQSCVKKQADWNKRAVTSSCLQMPLLTVFTQVARSRLRLTCCCAGHNGERCQGLVADVMAVDQEASQVFHDIKLAFQHLLGPLTHQITGGKPHVFLNTAQLAR